MIVYIAGYGRSGSTILDIKLGKTFGFVSLGEVASINSELDDQMMSRCGCGKRYSECKLWHTLDRIDKRQRQKNRLLLMTYQSPMPLKALFYTAYLLRYRQSPGEYVEAAVTSPLKLACDKYHDAIFIDSSKTTLFCAKRPQLLKRYGFEVVVIHIKRPLKDVLSSIEKGDNKFLSGKSRRKKHLRKIRAIFSYYLSNYYARRLRSITPYMCVFQLNLKNNERKLIKEIERFLHLHIVENYNQYTANHVVSGNRLKASYFAT